MENHSNEEQHCNIGKHPKQDFQVERIAFFSDAVFAIVITLLVIEFKVPHITDNSTFQDVCNQLFDLKYHFFAILFSFFLIASYWSRHHFLFKYIHNYNKQIIIANMLVLLPIIFFPFTTAFWAESFKNLYNDHYEIFTLGVMLFALNNFFAAMVLYIFYWTAIIKYKEMSYKIPTKERIGFVSNIWFMMTIFGVLFVITSITNNPKIVALVIWIVLALTIIFRKKIKNKLAENK